MLVTRAHVEFLAPVSAMSVAHQAELFQHVEGAIDGGRDRGRIDRPAALDELRPGQVAVGGGQDVDHRAALGGPPQPTLPQALADADPWLGE